MMNKPVWVIQGPNLNLLGEREPEIYGTISLSELQKELDTSAESLGLTLHHFQSNHEGAIVDKLQEIRHQAAGALLNAAGLTHTSIVLHDTLKAVGYPVVEIHLSDTNRRELFRRTSYLRSAAIATFQGEGIESYRKGLRFLCDYLDGRNPPRPTESNCKILYRTTETIRLDDSDAAGIMFHGHLFRICHHAYEKWMIQIGFPIGEMIQEKKWELPIAHIEGDFIKPLYPDQQVSITIELLRTGTRSLTLGYRVLDDTGQLCATASSVLVAVNPWGGKADFPEEFLAVLSSR